MPCSRLTNTPVFPRYLMGSSEVWNISSCICFISFKVSFTWVGGGRGCTLLVRFWLSFPLMGGSVQISVKLFLSDQLYRVIKQSYPDWSVLFPHMRAQRMESWAAALSVICSQPRWTQRFETEAFFSSAIINHCMLENCVCHEYGHYKRWM